MAFCRAFYVNLHIKTIFSKFALQKNLPKRKRQSSSWQETLLYAAEKHS